MATPTRPCPYCGAAVLMNAPACGTCGRPMPPMQAGAPPGGSAPAKTMFGYAAPQIPQAQQPARSGAPAPGPARPGSNTNPGGGFPPGQGFQPPQQQGFAPPPQQPAAPAQPQYPPQPQQPYGQPQGGQPHGGQPHGGQPYGQPPPQQGFGQPQGGPPYGQPQGGQPFQPPAPQQGFGQPQPQQPYGQPQQPAPYGQQPGPAFQQPHGQPQPGPTPYGAPQQPQPQQGFGGPPPGYPQAPNPFAPPQQDLPGPLDNMARGIPQSAPGTIFGIPVAHLRDASLQRKVLFFAGIALLASIVVPLMTSPTTVFPFSSGVPKWDFLIWPIIAGAAYLLVAAAPPNIRQQVPPAVLHWIPFGVAFVGLFVLAGMPGAGRDTLGILGYAVLVFGLLARIAQPQDQIARIIIAVGAGMLVPGWIDLFSITFHFSGMGVLHIVEGLINFIVITLGVLCILFVVPPQKLPPALQSLDAFGPLIAAVLILWLPAQVLLFILDGLMNHAGLGAILIAAHILVRILAFFGVLMMASPAAYEEMTALITGRRPPGSQPPQGGGFPPQGGGYPPQGGGYPPQGGGYPPQGGGGYPPQGGGGYPPQGGGGYPPQGGGGWQQ